MATSNLANLIILLLLPLICIVILVPIMFIFSKLFSILTSCDLYQEIKSPMLTMAIVLLYVIVVAFFGIVIIKTEEVSVRGIHFHGGEAIYIGIVYIVLAIFPFIVAAYLYIKKRNHNKINTADR